MKTHLIKIGNSRGIRIPKVFIEKCGFHEYVNMDVSDHQLIIAAVSEKRRGWEEFFAKEQGVTEKVNLVRHKFEEEE